MLGIKWHDLIRFANRRSLGLARQPRLAQSELDADIEFDVSALARMSCSSAVKAV